MNEFLTQLLLAVVTAAVPVITAYVVNYLRKAAANAEVSATSTEEAALVREVTNAVTDAVAATSQTYVDTLKNKGEFTKEAQKEAAERALNACLASLSPAAKSMLDTVYGSITEYLRTKIEAEVRSQKLGQVTVSA